MDFVDGDADVIGSESMEASVPALVKTSDFFFLRSSESDCSLNYCEHNHHA